MQTQGPPSGSSREQVPVGEAAGNLKPSSWMRCPAPLSNLGSHPALTCFPNPLPLYPGLPAFSGDPGLDPELEGATRGGRDEVGGRVKEVTVMVLLPRAGAVLVVPAGSSHGPQAGQGRAKRDGETGSLGGIRPSALRQADPGATEPVVSDELQSRCKGGQEGLLPRKWERLLLLLALPWVGGPSPCARGLVRGGGGRVSASPEGAPLGRVATLHWALS